MMEHAAKRATQKALLEFETANGLSPEKIFAVIENSSPGLFDFDEELYAKVKHYLFKKFDSISEQELQSAAKEICSGNLLNKWNKENKRIYELYCQLDTLREKIIEDVKTKEVKASDYPEWTEEVRQLIKDKTGQWGCIDENGNFMWGKSFNKQFCYYNYDHGDVPFHCYMWGKEDVLFTQNKYEWNGNRYVSSNSGCLSITALLISLSSLISILLIIAI